MSANSVAAQNTTLDGYQLNAVKDIPDIRDRIYEPSLIQLKNHMDPPQISVLDQGREGACTGFGLAAVINLLNQQRGLDNKVSPRMIYEMAKKYDEWPGEDYSGSSCRGAICGWFNMGVCDEKFWPYVESETGGLTIEGAKNARNNTIGAYYRLRHDIVDFHCALNETGVLYVSATVHSGWGRSRISHGDTIPFEQDKTGGHAFAIVGYNRRGFWVQNSWGPGWGNGGVALWTYEDWQKNIKDAWVVRMGVSLPQIRRTSSRMSQGIVSSKALTTGVYRGEIAGHFAHIDDGKYFNHGKYWSNPGDIKQTKSLVAASDKYDHLLVYAHGGLNSPDDSARRIRAMKEVFKNNRIYPFHFMYDTGLMEELKDIIIGKQSVTSGRVGGFTDFTDKILEISAHPAGKALWQQMKKDATVLFDKENDGSDILKCLVRAVMKAKPQMELHIIGHSNGSVLVGNLLDRLKELMPGVKVKTCNLMAPACTNDLFFSHYENAIKGGSSLEIQKTTIYNLADPIEQDDNVAHVYRKSLLYLVSNAFEDSREKPLLGMERFNGTINPPDYGGKLEIVYSHGKKEEGARTASCSHGGFDNDIYTMNDILKRITGKRTPVRPFTTEDLTW